MHFEWDEEKNLTNQTKHGISFEEAQELFRSDVDYLEIFDASHSDHEDRFIAIGPIIRGIVMVSSPSEMKTSSASSVLDLQRNAKSKCFTATSEANHD